MRVSDRDHPFYRPLWRRIAIVVVVAAWAAYEILVTADGFWTMLAVGFLAYAVWIFILDWRPAPDERSGTGTGGPEPPASG